MKRLVWVSLLVAACAAKPPADPAIERVKGLLAQQPRNTVYTYVLATYYDRAKDVRNVVRTLERLDELGWELGLGSHSFPNSASNRSFQRVAYRLAARELAVHRAEKAFTLPGWVDSEGTAYDPVDDVLIFSGGRDKLLRVDRSGAIREFPIEPFGDTGRLGMDVDAERRQIWVVNAPLRGEAASAISIYDLRDGRLVRRVTREKSFFNDLTLLRDGTAFVTDTNRHQVLRLAPGAESFETFAEDFRAPNGIAVSADEKTLYVADFRGLNAIDLASRSRQLVETNTLLNGIDGLTEHRGTLIGIQNVLGRPRVVRIFPNERRVEVLESKNPLLNVPATGVVAGDSYYFIANMSEKGAGGRVVVRIAL